MKQLTAVCIIFFLCAGTALAQTAAQSRIMTKVESYQEAHEKESENIGSRELTSEERQIYESGEKVLQEMVQANVMSKPKGKLTKWVGCWKGGDPDSVPAEERSRGEFCFKNNGDSVDIKFEWPFYNITCQANDVDARLIQKDTAYFFAPGSQVSCSTPPGITFYPPSRLEGTCGAGPDARFRCTASIYRIYNMGLRAHDSGKGQDISLAGFSVEIQTPNPPIARKAEMLAEVLNSMRDALNATTISFQIMIDGKRSSSVNGGQAKPIKFDGCTLSWQNKDTEKVYGTETLALNSIDLESIEVISYEAFWSNVVKSDPPMGYVVIKTKKDAKAIKSTNVNGEERFDSKTELMFDKPRLADQFAVDLKRAVALCAD